MDKITKYSFLVHGISILLGTVVSVSLIFTSYASNIKSYILGVCGGLISFSILFRSVRSIEKDAKQTKLKPSRLYLIYIVLALIFTGFFFFVIYYFQKYTTRTGFNLMFAFFGYLGDKIVQFVLAFTYARKVIF